MADRSETFVQPIVISKTGGHADTVLFGALASLGVYLRPAAEWATSPIPMANFAEWLDGPFTKTVRRGSIKDLARVLDWCVSNRVPYEAHEAGDSTAFALPPMRYADLPKAVSRLRVSGTDLPRTATTAGCSADEALVTVHVDDALTTGKAAAQAAHALWLWALDWLDDAQPPAVEAYLHGTGDGPLVRLMLTAPDDLASIADGPGSFAIRDNGLTEVEPGTLTAVATVS